MLKKIVGLALVAAVSACGGGGGGGKDTLYISVDYPSYPLRPLSAARIVPRLSGFDGHTPHCERISGELPPGMRVEDDCTLSGRPTQVGNFDFVVRVTASGADGFVDKSMGLHVRDIVLTYPGYAGYARQQLSVGDHVHDEPIIDGTAGARPDSGWVWTYRAPTGALPPGLVLDAASGVISGVPVQSGSFEATIQASVTTPWGSYTLPSTTYWVNVDVPMFGYMAVEPTRYNNLRNLQGYLGQPFKATPATPSEGRTLNQFSLVNGPLPPGLVFDSATGAVSGIPSEAPDTNAGALAYSVAATTTTTVGTSYPTTGELRLQINRPFYVYYSDPAGGRYPIGAPVNISPTFVQVTPDPLVSPSITYAPRGPDGTFGCDLPSGISVDPNAGVVSGTPQTRGHFSCHMDLTLMNNGFPWKAVATVYLDIY